MEFKLENKDILKTWYKDARNKVKENLGIKNPMAVPAISKIVINIGLKEAVSNSKIITLATNVLSEIAGQLPVKALAKKSIAGFKIRDGMPIGTFVTLRGLNMFVFLNKLINLTLPKVRDFQGVPLKLDGKGNYNLGIKDINVFPEAKPKFDTLHSSYLDDADISGNPIQFPYDKLKIFNSEEIINKLISLWEIYTL